MRSFVDQRAHARGLKIFGATLTPYEGAAYFSPEGEAKRQALNEWIRTSGAYDGVIDMDKAFGAGVVVGFLLGFALAVLLFFSLGIKDDPNADADE